MNSDQITEAYFDRILLKSRLIGSDLPDTATKIFGRSFETPVTTAALSHLDKVTENGMALMAAAAKRAGAIYFAGMTEDDEIERIQATGAAVVSIIKPHADNKETLRQIRHNVDIGVWAVGVDIDHCFNQDGGYDTVLGMPMRPKTVEELKAFVKEAGDTPFVIKGVLSVEDAEACIEAGVKGIVVSHHHGIMPSSVPPLMVLPEIKKAVGDRLTIFVDCGFDSGLDVFKGMALGADAVCVGRALMDPLKDGGEQGAYDAIMQISGQFKSVMARCGYHRICEIDDSCVTIF